jgi:molybdopterin/thiamine biosynthesis adenylyltransferase
VLAVRQAKGRVQGPLNHPNNRHEQDRTVAFSRERLAGYDPELMARKVVLAVGAGALGQNMLINLALSGVGELRIVDHDLFEPHNQTRSPCYPTREEQLLLGMEKARIVASRLLGLSTATQPSIRFASAPIQRLGLGAFAGVDVVVSCVDNARARAYLADATRLLGLTLVEGGFDGPEVSLSCYPPTRGQAAAEAPCWRCSHEELAGAFSCRFTAERAQEQGIVPAIQTAAATLGGLQAEHTILALHGHHPLASRVFDLDLRGGRSRLTKLSTDPACAGAHRSLPAERLPLRSRADSTIGELLAEASDALGGSPTLRLPDVLVATAHCSGCRHLVHVNEPSWSWITNMLCTNCDGTRARLTFANETDIPALFAELDDTVSEALLALPCSQVGLGPLDLIEAVGGDRQITVLKLDGHIDEIFERPTDLAREAY